MDATARLLLCRKIPHLVEHIFNENAVAGGGVVDKNVGHGADQLAVLENGTAAHTLNDAAAFFQQVGVGDLDGEAFIGKRVTVNIRDLDLVPAYAADVQRTVEPGFAGLYLVTLADGNRVV